MFFFLLEEVLLFHHAIINAEQNIKNTTPIATYKSESFPPFMRGEKWCCFFVLLVNDSKSVLGFVVDIIIKSKAFRVVVVVV